MRKAFFLPVVIGLLMVAGACSTQPTAAELAQRAADEASYARFTARTELEEKLTESADRLYSQEMWRIARARTLGVSDSSTNEELYIASRELERRQRAQELQLPPTATWDEVLAVSDRRLLERSRLTSAKRLGLPMGASWEQIDVAQHELDRIRAARRFNLQDSASLDEINHARDEYLRVDAARMYGLPDTATRTEIRAAAHRSYLASLPRLRAMHAHTQQQLAQQELQDRLRAENAVFELRTRALVRGLPATATADEVEAYDLDCTRRIAVAALGLPETASWGAIYDATHS